MPESLSDSTPWPALVLRDVVTFQRRSQLQLLPIPIPIPANLRILEEWVRCESLRLNEFVVDAWAQTETNRLRIIKNNQTSLQVDLYNELADAVGDTSASLETLGRRSILPSSYSGSPRQMVQLYQDALALVTEVNIIIPTLFGCLSLRKTWLFSYVYLQSILGRETRSTTSRS